MNDQGLAVQLMHLGLIGIASHGRKLRDQVQALADGLVGVDVVRIVVIVVQGQREHLQAVHQILRRGAQHLVDEKIIRQIIALGKRYPEFVKLLSGGQEAEQEQKDGLLVSVVALAVFDQIGQAVSAVQKIALAGNHIPLVIPGVTDDIGDSGQAEADAGSVLISKPFFDVVFLE